MEDFRKTFPLFLFMCSVVEWVSSTANVNKYVVASRDTPLEVAKVFSCGLKYANGADTSFRVSEDSRECFNGEGSQAADELVSSRVMFSTKNVRFLYSTPVRVSKYNRLSHNIPFLLTNGNRVIVIIGKLSDVATIEMRGNNNRNITLELNKIEQMLEVSDSAIGVSMKQDSAPLNIDIDNYRLTIDIQRKQFVVRVNGGVKIYLKGQLQAAPVHNLLCKSPDDSSYQVHSVEFQKVSLPLECSDLTSVSLQDGVYTIYPSGKDHDSRHVYCKFESDGSAWTVIQRRINGSVNFYRNWTDYKHGFGSASGEYWIGNDVIHKITDTYRHELLIVMTDFDEMEKYAKYSSFKVNNESDQYRLLVSGYSGNAGDSMSSHSNKPFTTFDRDNDDFARNCAKLYSGAWWYSDCHESNLNGQYFHSHRTTTPNGIHWLSWHGYYYSLKATTMMIKTAY